MNIPESRIREFRIKMRQNQLKAVNNQIDVLEFCGRSPDALAIAKGQAAHIEELIEELISERNETVSTVNWKPIEPKSDYSALRGIDEEGNRYYMTANREVVYCTLPGGFKGCGWTAEEALESAKANHATIIDKHNEVLEEMKAS